MHFQIKDCCDCEKALRKLLKNAFKIVIQFHDVMIQFCENLCCFLQAVNNKIVDTFV